MWEAGRTCYDGIALDWADSASSRNVLT